MPRRKKDTLEKRKERMMCRYNELVKGYSYGSLAAKHDMAIDQLHEEFFLEPDTINKILFKAK
jgi:hypothetical protein